MVITAMPSTPPGHRDALALTVGVAALVAPALHSLTDVIESLQQGFSTFQLWLNYLAFLPMPWLLLGIYAVRDRQRGIAGLVGALLYGVSFTYFAHTTLYALAEQVPDYAALWARLGATYTVHGGLMVLGGLLFGLAGLRSGWLPRGPVLLFLAGIITNLVLALLPAPDILQTVGSALRNVGLMALGYGILADGRPDR